MSKEQFSFAKGWAQVRQCDVANCRKALMQVLNITTRAAFLQRMKGNVIPNVLEVNNVEKVFAKYGIKEACKKNYVLRSCVAMVNGKITQKEVADSQHCEYTPLDPDTMF